MAISCHKCGGRVKEKAPPDKWKIIFRIGGALFFAYRFVKDLWF